MNMVEIELAIDSRLNASPIVPAAQGAWNTVAPDDIITKKGSKPIVTFFQVSGSFQDSTFVNNVADAVYQVNIFDHRSNGMAAGMDVWKKVFGDSQGTDNTPTHGLARWLVTGLADMGEARLVPENFGTQHANDSFHWWITFSLSAEEA